MLGLAKGAPRTSVLVGGAAVLGEVHAQRLDVLADAQHAGHLHPHEHPAGEHLVRGIVRCNVCAIFTC